MTVGVRNYPRKPLSERERTIREAIDRILGLISTTLTPGVVTGAHTTSDQTFTSSTLANVTDLSFVVANGRYHYIRFDLLVRNSALNEGAKFTLTVPAVTRFVGKASAVLGNGGAVTTWEDTILSSGDAVVTVNFPTINTDFPVTVECVIVPSADGTVQLQAANESGVCTVTVRQGSVGMEVVL